MSCKSSLNLSQCPSSPASNIFGRDFIRAETKITAVTPRIWLRKKSSAQSKAAVLLPNQAREHRPISADEFRSSFYADNCYYLDNLCVDFRCQRMGIGQRLVAWGVDRARGNRLPIQTEASPKGRSLYLKVGFQQIGTWTISIPHYDQELVEMPVMRLQTT